MPRRPNATVLRTRRSLADRVAACDVYFRLYGIRRVSMTMLAQWCQTTEAELYRLFPSIDRVVAGYISREAKADKTFPLLKDDQVTDPLTLLRNYIEAVQVAVGENYDGRYRMAQIATDLTEKYPVSREMVRKWKAAELHLIRVLCSRAKCSDDELLADKLYLVLEGARWGLDVFGLDSPSRNLVAASEDLIAAHIP